MVEILLERLVGEGLEKTWDFNFHLGVKFKPICTCWTPSCPLLRGEAAVICGGRDRDIFLITVIVKEKNQLKHSLDVSLFSNSL